MNLTWNEIQANAIAFVKRWKDGANERQEAQSFVRAFLSVFGVETTIIDAGFENAVRIGRHDKYIDYLWPGQLAIEMKSKGKDLKAAFTQLQNYMTNLPNAADVPDLWLVCDFENMQLSRRSTNEIWKFKTKDLRKHIKKFANIAGYTTARSRDDQVEVNVKAAEKMAKLHDALKAHGYEGHELEVYLVRLLFCLFADDTGIFPSDSFINYIEASKTDGSDLSDRITRLFDVLNMPEDVRTRRTLLTDELKQFRYVNGGLFAERLTLADFDAKMRQTLIDCANFDWNTISPAIFGAMFQGVIDKNQRREMGAHYTSEENILRLINPLFLDDLWKEFDRVKTDPTALERFHSKLGQLKFLDPACGCGNFLIVTYRELRNLELEVLKMKLSRAAYTQFQMYENPLEQEIYVNVNQFYGIEYEEFPCQIAQVGMWLMDHQMNNVVADYFGIPFVRLPLTQSATVVHDNALRIDWEDVVPKAELSFILGNPPFVGHQYRSIEQQEDMKYVYKDSKNFGKLDYVCCWYKKSIDLMVGTRIHAALVSTNSIVQGESVSLLWKPIFEQGFEITFAYTPFVWSNEAKGNAAVHCVIVGFAPTGSAKQKRLFNENLVVETENINGYLLPVYNVFIQSRGKPLNPRMPKMSKGSQPTDGGNLILSVAERDELIEQYPQSADLIKRYIVADDFINGNFRYCLWLKGIAPTKYRMIKPIMQRLEKVSEARRASPTVSVRRDADTPMLFTQIRQPESDFIAIPRVSSERRRYIPIGFLSKDIIVGDAVLVIENISLYFFGILTSNVHNAWTRTVCGRLKSDIRYTSAIYNNFPWLDATDTQRAEIEKLAQGVLDARALFTDSTLADLYDPLTMPPELLKAHQALDMQVMKLYGFTPQNTPTEADCVAKLMELYRVVVGAL